MAHGPEGPAAFGPKGGTPDPGQPGGGPATKSGGPGPGDNGGRARKKKKKKDPLLPISSVLADADPLVDDEETLRLIEEEKRRRLAGLTRGFLPAPTATVLG